MDRSSGPRDDAGGKLQQRARPQAEHAAGTPEAPHAPPAEDSKPEDAPPAATPPRTHSSTLTRLVALAAFAFTCLGVARLATINADAVHAPSRVWSGSVTDDPIVAAAEQGMYERVFWYAWITAASTALGAAPFIVFKTFQPVWLAVSNAVAGGMMLAASGCLAVEGVLEHHRPQEETLLHVRSTQAAAAAAAAATTAGTVDAAVAGAAASGNHHTGLAALASWFAPPWAVPLAGDASLDTWAIPQAMWWDIVKVATGIAVGMAFIVASQHVLDRYEHLKFSGFEGASARRMLLILAVMTLHSLSEGIGIGVSFGSEAHAHASAASAATVQAPATAVDAGGSAAITPADPPQPPSDTFPPPAAGSSGGASGGSFGVFISLTLAIHNVPEGLATCLVLIPRGVPVLEAALWSLFTSLPQPLMALPAFAFVQRFLPFMPVGLGFAAGAMSWVAWNELLAEAAECIGRRRAMLAAAAAAGVMLWLQHTIR